MTYDIQPTSLGPLGTARKIEITVRGFNILENQCVINYQLYSQNNNGLGGGRLLMSGTTYENWGYDNNYVKDFVFNSLNLQSV
jgi:hypothetical protein